MMPVVDRLQTAAGLTDIGVVSLRRLKTSLPHVQLSDRELQVLRLIGGGRTVTEVSAELGLSVKTISTYRRRILEKLELRTSAELIHYAVTNRLAN
jgi:DNA-binding NarL/FixJ family response regulator